MVELFAHYNSGLIDQLQVCMYTNHQHSQKKLVPLMPFGQMQGIVCEYIQYQVSCFFLISEIIHSMSLNYVS